MNGFEPLRRRIIDYTEAGQWSEVYDGPLEDCESEKLKAENAKLVMKLNAEHLVRQNVERENAKLRDEFRKMDEWHSKELFAAIDENKRLRELVRHLRECTRHNVCALCDYAEDACDFDYDMRELGVVE